MKDECTGTPDATFFLNEIYGGGEDAGQTPKCPSSKGVI